jgi:CRISPR/Cas system CSM-associated protein Csm4 (group 5 of RAMP superfamily)
MRAICVILLLTLFIVSKSTASGINGYIQALQNDLKKLSIKELKQIMDMVNAYESSKKQVKEMRYKEEERNRKTKQEREEKRLKNIQANFKERIGRINVLMDFYADRIF